MAFPDFLETPRFPDGIAQYGSSGAAGWATDVVKLGSGFEQRNATRQDGLGRYELNLGVLTTAQRDTLVAWLYNTRGRAQGFRFRDWADYSVSGGLIATAVAAQVAFQLVKEYAVCDAAGVAVQTSTRQIKKPLRQSAWHQVTIGAPTSGHWHLTYGADTTGAIAWNANGPDLTTLLEALPGIGAGNVLANRYVVGQYTIRVQGTLAYQAVALPTGDISALAGPAFLDASSLQTGTHVRLWVDGAEKTEGTHYTVDYATGIATFGTAPGAGKVITGTFEFDLPVRFDTDQPAFSHEDFALHSAGTVPLVELKQ